MSTLLFCTAALWLLAATIHGWLGTRVILRPVLEARLARIVRGTSEVAWHGITWQFVVLGAFGVWSALTGRNVDVFAALSGSAAFGFALLFLALGFRRFGDPWHMPQWVLFVPIVLASAWVLTAPGALPLEGLAVVARVVAVVLLVAIGAAHVAWALGSSFPARSRAELARLVVGAELGGSIMPGRLMTFVVALLLFGAAGCVIATGLVPQGGAVAAWLHRIMMALVVVFGLRGILGFFEVAFRPTIRGTPYMTWSRRLYSPIALCLALVIGVGASA